MVIKEYYELAKPGIIYGNALTATAGFFLASPESLAEAGLLFATMLIGLSLIIASACVFNNYFDRDIDAKMERTKNRALAAGRIPAHRALTFAAILGLLGALVLWLYTTTLALGVALVGFGVYVFLYTPLKHKTPHALWVGAIAGATPPVVGYTAVTATLDWYALALFTFLFLWQIPHFLSIALYRHEEYQAAGIPLFIHKAPTEQTKRRARQVFFLSLVVLLLWCTALILQRWIR
jgi:protoheme IX farnesyltransferase